MVRSRNWQRGPQVRPRPRHEACCKARPGGSAQLRACDSAFATSHPAGGTPERVLAVAPKMRQARSQRRHFLGRARASGAKLPSPLSFLGNCCRTAGDYMCSPTPSARFRREGHTARGRTCAMGAQPKSTLRRQNTTSPRAASSSLRASKAIVRLCLTQEGGANRPRRP